MSHEIGRERMHALQFRRSPKVLLVHHNIYSEFPAGFENWTAQQSASHAKQIDEQTEQLKAQRPACAVCCNRVPFHYAWICHVCDVTYCSPDCAGQDNTRHEQECCEKKPKLPCR